VLSFWNVLVDFRGYRAARDMNAELPTRGKINVLFVLIVYFSVIKLA